MATKKTPPKKSPSKKINVLVPKAGKIGSTNKNDYVSVSGKEGSSSLNKKLSKAQSSISKSNAKSQYVNQPNAPVTPNAPTTPKPAETYTGKYVGVSDQAGAKIESDMRAKLGYNPSSPIPAPSISPYSPQYTPPAQTPTTSNMAVANDTTAAQVGVDATSPVSEPLTLTQQRQNDLYAAFQQEISNQGDQAAQVAKIEKDAKLAKKREKANKISSELDQLDLDINNNVREMRKNPEGKFAGAVEQDVQNAQETYEYRRANVSIAYKVALGDYQGAQEDVDRKIQAMKDQSAQRLNLLQFGLSFLQASKNDLTESEKIKLTASVNSQAKREEQVSNAYSQVTELATQNGASAATLDAIDRAARAPDASVASVYAAAGKFAVDKSQLLDNEYKRAQIEKLRADAAADLVAASGTNRDPVNLAAYAAEYLETGKLPSPSEQKAIGYSAGEIAQQAKQIPRSTGAVVSKSTGVKPVGLSVEDQKSVTALTQIVTKTLPALEDRFSKISATGSGKLASYVYTSQDRKDYNIFRNEFLSQLLVARSGATVSEPEYKRYSDMVPTDLANFGIKGITDQGGKTLKALRQTMTSTLDTYLDKNQLSVYGYSTVNVPIKGVPIPFTVGQTIQIGENEFRVLPDGTLTDTR